MKVTNIPDEIVFNRPKKFKYIEEIGAGACGRTILIRDEDMGVNLVAKKYSPLETIKSDTAYYLNFLDRFREEAKMLFKLNHPNIVRVYSFFEYRENVTAYIIMEHINGSEVTDFLQENPDSASKVFISLIEAFSYLERKGILHRDIRPANILVDEDQNLKVIDFGFGKEIETTEAKMEKSISLNWWCETPRDFDTDIYDFCTEVYFVGQLFRHAISGLNLEEFPYKKILDAMCHPERAPRPDTFTKISMEISKKKFDAIEFTNKEITIYRSFSEALLAIFSSLEHDAKIVTEPEKILPQLKTILRNNTLEDTIASPILLARAFVVGGFRFWSNRPFPTETLRDFLALLEELSTEKRSIALSNIASRLEAIRKSKISLDDEIPF